MIISVILGIYALYWLIGGLLVFALPKKISHEYAEESNPDRFYSHEEGADRAAILDNPLESGLARLFIIENAKESLDVAYFSIEKGETPHIFLGALFDAADRGVKVDILLDGIFHGLRGARRAILYAISNHPNMHLKIYEKINPFMPWTLNNRMHDKYIIADGKAVIMGGRNIGDKYFAPEWYKREVTNDRDVVIINFGERGENSAVDQMSAYFDRIWNHKYAQEVNLFTRSIFRKMASSRADRMRKMATMARDRYREQFDQAKDLHQATLATNKVTFIHNPIQRFSKEPWCWYELLGLSKQAKEAVFVQSPYIIPNRKMTKGLVTRGDLQGKKVTFLTNSLASTPNIPAFSGYLNYRKKLVDWGIHILEIQSKDSIHSKAFVIDKEIAVIGSFNLDPRSAFLSTESMLVIHSPGIVESFGDNIFNYTDESLLINEDYKYISSDLVEALPVSRLKKMTFYLVSKLVRFFDYML